MSQDLMVFEESVAPTSRGEISRVGYSGDALHRARPITHLRSSEP
jgi:hypothetical protein